MPSIEERRRIAETARLYAETDAPFWDLNVARTIADEDADWPELWAALADLIDPTEHERTIADNLALVDRNRELECELAECKSKLGAVSRIADELHGDAASELDAWGDIPLPRHVAREVVERCRISKAIREAVG